MPKPDPHPWYQISAVRSKSPLRYQIKRPVLRGAGLLAAVGGFRLRLDTGEIKTAGYSFHLYIFNSPIVAIGGGGVLDSWRSVLISGGTPDYNKTAGYPVLTKLLIQFAEKRAAAG